MSAKANIVTTTAIAFTIALGVSGGAFAYHDRLSDGMAIGGGQFHIHDCVHVQFPQCSDSDSTATRN
jgi:hypothetical protein